MAPLLYNEDDYQKIQKKHQYPFLKDLKLTTSQKESISVLLTADEEIVWVVGLRVDERFKVTDATRSILKVSIKD